MNEEEKKAIEFIKDLNDWDVRKDLYQNKEECENIEIILNLIEKLQKENEELKNKKYIMTISCDGECQICKHCENETIFENRIEELEEINEEHQKINGKLRDELNLLKKQKQDVLDFLEVDCEGDCD